MDINLAAVQAELTDAFDRYEQALLGNDPDALNAFFWKSPLAIRYGVAENLYGYDEIVAYRAGRAKTGGAPQRVIKRKVITTFGHHFGTADIDYVRPASSRNGRQSQTWAKMPEGWRIVSAHVSLILDADR